MLKNNLALNPSISSADIVEKYNDLRNIAQFKGCKQRFAVITFEDRRLVRKHGGMGLQDYWLDCWETDPFGSRYVLMPDVDFRNTTQAKYRKQLEELGLFMFEPRGRGESRQMWLLNRHGSKSQKLSLAKANNSLDRADNLLDDTAGLSVGIKQVYANTDKSLDRIAQLKAVIQSESEVQKSSLSFQNLLNKQQYLSNIAGDGAAAAFITSDKKEEEKGNQEGSSPGIPASLI